MVIAGASDPSQSWRKVRPFALTTHAPLPHTLTYSVHVPG